MSALRIFDPYAFLGGEDRLASPAKAANPAKDAESEAGTLATVAALADTCPEIETSGDRDQAALDRSVDTELPPMLLADGRRLHRFGADAIPLSVPGEAVALLDEVRWHGAVLVADGCELIIVERWQSALPPEALQAIKSCAGAIIAVLRGEFRRRCAGHE